MDSSKPNTTIKLVFKETWSEEDQITFLNIFLEKEEGGREVNVELISGNEATIAETWGHEMLGFVEDFLRRQLNGGEMQGFMLSMPKKKDMN